METMESSASTREIIKEILRQYFDGKIVRKDLTKKITDELANSLQVCLDSGAKKVLLPLTSAVDLGTVPPELIGSFNVAFYNCAEDAVFKALGVE